MRNFRFFFFVCLLCLQENCAYANFSPSNGANVPLGLFFLVWLILGTRCRWGEWKIELFHSGGCGTLLGLIMFFIAPLSAAMPYSIPLAFWMIYLTITVADFLFIRTSEEPGKRMGNILFHGSFLLLSLLAGIFQKTGLFKQTIYMGTYWQTHGIYETAWKTLMIRYWIPIIQGLGIGFVLVLAFVFIRRNLLWEDPPEKPATELPTDPGETKAFSAGTCPPEDGAPMPLPPDDITV